MGFCSWDQCRGGETQRVLKRLNLVTFFFFLIQSPEMMCACFWKVGAVLFQGPTSVDCTSLQGEPPPTPRAFLKRRTPDTSQLFPALTEWAVHTLYPLTQSSLKPVWWVFLLPHFKAQEARREGGLAMVRRPGECALWKNRGSKAGDIATTLNDVPEGRGSSGESQARR